MRTHLFRPTTSALAVTALACVLALSGCGSDSTSDSSSDSTSPSATPTPTPSSPSSSSPTSAAPSSAATSSATTNGTQIDITIDGDDVSPSGDRISVSIGETITLNVTSNRAGELHVHSTPEQELEYAVGTTTLQLTFDKPGIVDVEDHVADVVIAQLEVS